MRKKETKSRFLKATTLAIVGVLLLVFTAVLLLWYGNANSMQAAPAMVAGVYFDGEYRIADGQWQKIEKGKHISSTEGDVTLRGNFHLVAPDGEYVGVYTDSIPIALYTDHINLTFYEGENEPFIIDVENPLYGDSACHEDWSAYVLTSGSEEPIEILIHNPHRFGNETAIDEMLSSTALWTDIEFEKGVLESGKTQRDIGLLFAIISLVVLGTALFSTLIHIKNSKIIWLFGTVILFAGTYLSYSADGVSFWNESVVSNTTILGCSMMFYMFFLCVALVQFLKDTRTIGIITVTLLGVVNAVVLVLPVLTDILFFDTWLYWASVQILANIILLGCLIRELVVTKGKERWLYFGAILPLVSFGVDVIMTDLGLWKGGVSSRYIFTVFFVVAMVVVLKVIPNGINALSKAKELETEKIVLNAELTESRISTMMSQIRPHFIYNTLGSIEQLCIIDPSKAGELVHNFAKYLRGNFGELDNPKPILMSQEMEHVRHYISIENVRFPDMTFSFEMNSDDFHIPALTIQPIVENAIKHGLMKLSKGGTIRVVSYETESHYCVSVEDDGVGFDTDVLLDERKHVGIRNIRGRLKTMVNGTLEIESRVGIGTTVLIKIPKEVAQ
ncbi:MAG: histidine kinase [Acutalibacteraceae bacterium]|nr:histidine kinase [Acutalibacteraceae bacterium]